MAEVWAIIDIILIVWVFIMVVGFLITISFIVLRRSQYKHHYLRLVLTSTSPVGILDFAKEHKEQDGTIFWKLLKAKHTINKPPAEAIIPLQNGRFFVKAFDLGNMNYKYTAEELDKETLEKVKEIEEKITINLEANFFKKIREKLIDMRRTHFVRRIRAKPTPLTVYPTETYTKAFTKEVAKDIINADERQNVYYQIRKAYEKKVKGWEKWGLPIVVVVCLVVLISVMFIFGENLIRPITEMQGLNLEISESNKLTQERITEALRYVAIILEQQQFTEAEAGGTVALLNKTAPN